MTQTPNHSLYNRALLRLMRADFKFVVEIGASGSKLASVYRGINPHCHYVGVESDPSHATFSSKHCSEIITTPIERFSDEQFAQLRDADCWVFSDELERFRNPWALLKKIHRFSMPHVEIFTYVLNMQHWSVQSALCAGRLHHPDVNLSNKNYLQFFSRKTMLELFKTTGFRIDDMSHRLAEPPEAVSAAIRTMAEVSGGDSELAVKDSHALQWAVRAVKTQGASA